MTGSSNASGWHLSESQPVASLSFPGNVSRFTGQEPPGLAVRFHDATFAGTPGPGFIWSRGSWASMFRQAAWNSQERTWRVEVERPVFTSSAECSGYVTFTVRVEVE